MFQIHHACLQKHPLANAHNRYRHQHRREPSFRSTIHFLSCLVHFRITSTGFVLVDFGAAIRLASTTVPPCMTRPASSRRLFTSAKIFSPILPFSSIWRNMSNVVALGTCYSLKFMCINVRMA